MIHPTAILEGTIEWPEDGPIEIGAHAVLRGTIRLGRNCKILPLACIEGHVEMGDNNTLCQGAVIGGNPQDLGFDPDTPSGVRIGSGNTFREHVTVNRATRPGAFTTIGDGNFFMAGSHVGHDGSIGNGNVIANQVLMGGHVQLGNHAFLGGASVFHQFVRIGDRAMVQGMGGFSMDIPPYVIAHEINQLAGLNVVGLRRAGIGSESRAQLKRAFEMLHKERLRIETLRERAAEPGWMEEAARFFAFVLAESRKGICR